VSQEFIIKFRLFANVECRFDIVAGFGNDVETNFVLLTKSKQIEHAENGNSVEATFDFVERIVRLVAFDNVALTLLLVWMGLKGVI